MQSVNSSSRTGRERVVVFDTTLRDGEHAAGVCFSKGAKVEIATILDGMGVDVIEAGFPGSSAGEHEAVRAVSECVRRARVCGLSRAIPAEVDRTWLALRGARRPRIHVFLSSSEIHLAHQLHRGADEVVEMARAAVERARGYTDDVEWSCMDATRSDPELIARLVRVAIAAGATTINLPDTVGCARRKELEAVHAAHGATSVPKGRPEGLTRPLGGQRARRAWG